jgi:hypothetical protein
MAFVWITSRLSNHLSIHADISLGGRNCNRKTGNDIQQGNHHNKKKSGISDLGNENEFQEKYNKHQHGKYMVNY